MLCPFCLHERFDPALRLDDAASTDALLPEGIMFQQALWKFDREGALQDLLHHMKYDGIKRIGREFGEILGSRLKNHSLFQQFLEEQRPILVPVPLHRFKKNIRGYNQARMIAEGLSRTLSLPVIAEGAVVRDKHTRTQTGFNLNKRLENMKGAFKVKHEDWEKYSPAILVDDVFTTGATSFELWRALYNAGVEKGAIITVAQA